MMNLAVMIGVMGGSTALILKCQDEAFATPTKEGMALPSVWRSIWSGCSARSGRRFARRFWKRKSIWRWKCAP